MTDRGFDVVELTKEQYQSGWNRAYQTTDNEKNLWKSEPIEFLPKYMDILKQRGVVSILDAGCGDGRNTIALLKYGFFVAGVDLSVVALGRALQKARSFALNSVSLVRGDIEELPLPFVEDLFDCVACLDVFGQLLHVEAALDGFRRLTRPGGYILMNLYTPNDATYGSGEKVGPNTYLYRDTLFRFFDHDDVRALVKDFEIVEQTLMSWQDPPHPGFREHPHTHENHVLLLRRLD